MPAQSLRKSIFVPFRRRRCRMLLLLNQSCKDLRLRTAPPLNGTPILVARGACSITVLYKWDGDGMIFDLTFNTHFHHNQVFLRLE
jgi:hypothetical protein